MSKSTRISRRTVLRGLGTAVALPWLEASLPRAAWGADAGKPPVRMAFLAVPNGMHMPDWTPVKDGRGFDSPPTLARLAEHQDAFNVLSGLTELWGRRRPSG